MGASEGNEVRKFVRQAMGERLEGRREREDGERASAGRVPVDTDVALYGAKVSTQPMTWTLVRGRRRTEEVAMRLVSQALLVTLTLSMPYSFLPCWPKTWLSTGLRTHDPRI